MLTYFLMKIAGFPKLKHLEEWPYFTYLQIALMSDLRQLDFLICFCIICSPISYKTQENFTVQMWEKELKRQVLFRIMKIVLTCGLAERVLELLISPFLDVNTSSSTKRLYPPNPCELCTEGSCRELNLGWETLAWGVYSNPWKDDAAWGRRICKIARIERLAEGFQADWAVQESVLRCPHKQVNHITSKLEYF